MPNDHDASTTYSSYLALTDLLAAQRPRSEEHDEMLFIVIHQVYELWFKQLLHELRALQGRLEAGATPQVMSTLKRILTILKTVVAQVDILETMTPRQFSAFRSRLDAASGFQSAQFREITAVLGGRGAHLSAAHAVGTPEHTRILDATSRRSLYDSFVVYLSREGYEVPLEALNRDVSLAVEGSPALEEVILRAYSDDGNAAQVAERLVDLDEGLQEWRYRHVKMVERTIGDKRGTGGSSGVEYLRTTVFRPAFPDLWAVRSRL